VNESLCGAELPTGIKPGQYHTWFTQPGSVYNGTGYTDATSVLTRVVGV